MGLISLALPLTSNDKRSIMSTIILHDRSLQTCDGLPCELNATVYRLNADEPCRQIYRQFGYNMHLCESPLLVELSFGTKPASQYALPQAYRIQTANVQSILRRCAIIGRCFYWKELYMRYWLCAWPWPEGGGGDAAVREAITIASLVLRLTPGS